jgi:formylmethanofuran dehydrogenase subunit D
MGVSTSTVWYNIKNRKIKKTYLAECGNCHMNDKDEIMGIVKENDKKYQNLLAKKEAVLNKRK